MRLLCFIEKINNSLKIIPLSSKYSYDSNGMTVTINLNKQSIDNFYNSKIDDIAVLVGRNGVGKTTHLKKIIQALSLKNYSDTTVIYSDNSDNFYSTNPKFVSLLTFITPFTNKNITISDSNSSLHKKSFSSSSIFFYSPTIESTSNTEVSDNCTNLTTSHLLAESLNFSAFNNSDMKKQFALIKENNKIMEIVFPNDTNQELSCTITLDSFDIEESHTETLIDGKTNLYTFKRFENEIHLKKAYFINYGKLWSKVKELSNFQFKLKDTYSSLDPIGFSSLADKDSKKIMNKLKDRGMLQQSLEAFYLKNLLNLFPFSEIAKESTCRSVVDNLATNSDFISLNEHYNLLFDFLNNAISNKHFLEFDNGDITMTFTSSLENDFIQKYFTPDNNNIALDFISFKWIGLSSGENYLLNLYSRFFSISNKNQKNYIFFDELDLGLHPKWQQELMKNVFNIFPKLFPNSKLQFILTSHSPLILSDFRSLDIHLLSQNSEEACHLNNNDLTFAANINSLMADSFFLDGALMGAFAKDKLHQLINQLLSKDIIPELNELKKIIDSVGEPILKNELVNMYKAYEILHSSDHFVENNDYINSITDIQTTIDSLKIEIKALKENGYNGKN